MNPPSSWWNAQTLKERADARRVGQNQKSDPQPLPEAAKRRLDAWRAQTPFAKGDFFARRLAVDGITEAEFEKILGESADQLQERSPVAPPWLERLLKAFDSLSVSDPSTDADTRADIYGFLEVIAPLINLGQVRIEAGIKTIAQTNADLPFDADAVVSLVYPNLASKLIQMIDRTSVLELNVARLRGQLTGETAEARFLSFVRQLRERDRALAFFGEYPVLARQILQTVDHWATFYLEFFRHLAADWSVLRATFPGGLAAGKLEAIKGGAGDSHREGRSVLIAQFASGFTLAYKPRSMALDLHFQELLVWLNARGGHPPFRTLLAVDRGEYGWIEFVVAKGCESEAELVRFYQRQGGYLALLYALDATDFHTENLIAEGEHPVLLDLEALFHAHVGQAGAIGQIEQLAGDAIDNSVLRIGLLPHRIWANDDSEGVDLSGLGSAEGQTSPHPVPHWQGMGTDEMRMTRERMTLRVGDSRPALQGAEVDILDYAGDITKGFVEMYRLLEKHRSELLAADGPLVRFANDEVRAILRATQTYSSILRESYHPDLLRDALDRDRLFDRLWIQVEYMPHLARTIPFELADFQQGDIPMFTTRPDSRDLWSSTGARLPNFFAESSFAHVRRRLGRLGDKDLGQQLWFVRASLATVSKQIRGAQAYPDNGALPEAGARELIAIARAIGDRLENLALQGDGAVTWMGLTQSNERHWKVIPAGLDLYDGLPGIGLFLAQLAAVTGEARYQALAQKTIDTMRQQAKQHRLVLTSVGAFDGWGGVIYALTHLHALWSDPELLQEAHAIVELLPPLIERDEYLDIIAGTAGCLGTLLSLYRHAPSERTLAVARLCGERLAARATAMPEGVAWLTPIAKERALSGFAHGVAGIAWALLELAELSGEERYRALANDATTYERSLFSPEQKNWLDLRGLSGEAPLTADERAAANSSHAWCHGAPGIGLARFSTCGRPLNERTREEIGIALASTWQSGFGQNHSLCHGDLGNLEILASGGAALGDPKWQARTEEMTAKVLERISREGWKCGNPQLVESPGLMTGLAGIGYGLLRLAEPERIPSVLILAPPRPSRPLPRA